MSEIIQNYWQLFQKKGDKLLVLLGRPKKIQVRKIVGNYLTIIIGILIVAFILISSRIYITSMGYTISHLQKQLHQVENLQRMLRVEVASLRSADRIEKIATQMGLVIPDKVEVVYLPEPKYLTVENEESKIFLTNFFRSRKAEAGVIE